jgi:precorrin-2 methylase
MDWNALVGALIGASIPGILTYLGLRRGRQSADAEAFGAAILLLDRVNPERVSINLNPDTTAESAKWAELQEQLAVARGRLLVVSAGHPRRHVRELALATEVKVTNAFQASHWAVSDMQANRDNREWMDRARRLHTDAEAALRQLIDANFTWSIFGRRRYGSDANQTPRQPEIEGD